VTREPQSDLAGLERAIGRALRWGTIVSSVCLAVALAMALAASYAGGTPRLIAAIGVLILIVTPVVRVIISFVEYLRDRDWVFVTMTAIVLLSLAGSVAAAFLY
jgi:uncharacterized membrane protein